jgi:hypothetical protein
MPESRETLRSILERALVEPTLLEQLSRDPLGTLRDAGVGCTLESIKHWLGVQGATDLELVQMLYRRLAPRDCSGGIGAEEQAAAFSLH